MSCLALNPLLKASRKSENDPDTTQKVSHRGITLGYTPGLRRANGRRFLDLQRQRERTNFVFSRSVARFFLENRLGGLLRPRLIAPIPCPGKARTRAQTWRSGGWP